METPLFIDNNSKKLFAVLHRPNTNKDRKQSTPITGIVFCHPFAEEKLISQRVLVNLARQLCLSGYYVLRFDYMGHGDSEGDFEEATVKTRLSDINRAVEYLRDTVCPVKIGLLGIRFGATLATLASENDKCIDFLISISPIVKGATYIYNCLRSNLTTQMAVFGKIKKTRKQLVQEMQKGNKINIDGYLISHEFYKQCQNIDLMESVGNHQTKIHILQISNNEKKPIDKLYKDLYAIYQQNGYDISIHNIVDDLFWTDINYYRPGAENLGQEIIKLLPGSLRKVSR